MNLTRQMGILDSLEKKKTDRSTDRKTDSMTDTRYVNNVIKRNSPNNASAQSKTRYRTSLDSSP